MNGGIYFLISQPGWLSNPPFTSNHLICSSHFVSSCCSHSPFPPLFYSSLLLSVSCYQVFSSCSLALAIYHRNTCALSLSLLWPLGSTSLALTLCCCSVKIHLIFMSKAFCSSPLLPLFFCLGISVATSDGVLFFFFFSPYSVGCSFAAH